MRCLGEGYQKNKRGEIFANELEAKIAQIIRPILRLTAVGESIRNLGQFYQVLGHLEWYLPEVLNGAHPRWERNESFDGLISFVSKKTGNDEIEIFGEAILISDQTTVPLHLRFQVSPVEDEITWLELRIGESTADGMHRIPYNDEHKSRIGKMINLAASEENVKNFNWAYHVAFGERHL